LSSNFSIQEQLITAQNERRKNENQSHMNGAAAVDAWIKKTQNSARQTDK